MKQLKAILIGAGMRGAFVYSEYAISHPNELKVIAVAEPDAERRSHFANKHHITEKMQFTDWKEALKKGIEADFVMICTQDRMHYEPVMLALEKGYHVLCEKPMSPEKEEIIEMGAAAEKYNRQLIICHVLRYSPFFTKIKELLDRKAIGELMSIQHIESVGYWHQAHSFVRGNWRNEEETSPMILQKCCHDMDILLWLTGSHCKRIHSFGSLRLFKEENAPEGAPAYCLDGCAHREECPFYAPRFYLEHVRREGDGFAKAVSIDTSPDKLMKALQKGPYGRCVYRCDNNVVDHQVVNIEFENAVTASFTMCAFTNECERIINLMGTRGQIKGNMEQGSIELMDFITGNKETVQLNTSGKGHSGSDERMMKAVVALLAAEDKKGARTAAEISVESHLMSLAAEESRRNGAVISMKEYQDSNL